MLLVPITSFSASPLFIFMSRKASAPLPPPLLRTMVFTSSSLWVVMIDWIRRPSWSVPPPGPPATTISTFLSGCQALAKAGRALAVIRVQPRNRREVRRTNAFRMMEEPRFYVLVIVMSDLTVP
ncbi:hypothetical protein D3C79_747720 [compost metagenome]